MQDQFEEDALETVTMTDEDGSEVEFAIVDHVTCGTERYLLVVECDAMEDDEEADALLLKEVAIGTDDVTYEIVEDDANLTVLPDYLPKKGKIMK